MALLEKLLELNASMKYLSEERKIEAFDEIIVKISGKKLEDLIPDLEKEIKSHSKRLQESKRHDSNFINFKDNLIIIIMCLFLIPIIFFHILPSLFFVLVGEETIVLNKPYCLLFFPFLTFFAYTLLGFTINLTHSPKRTFNRSRASEIKRFIDELVGDLTKIKFWCFLFGPSLFWTLMYLL